IFGIGKKTCSKAIHSVRTALMTSFVPKHLGLSHIDRTDVINNHTTAFANVLFGDSKSDVAIAVADGTYIYIEKSGNYSFQRRSYSVHKGQPLLKPMMLVASDGYILTVLGPYLADGKNSDAKITEHMLKSNAENITDWFEKDDVLIVDRGFRDAIDILKDFGINSHMPHFLNKSQKQHTTEEANESRLVTKVRWVVESANGRIKKWKALSNTMPNSQIPYIGDYVRIVCSICNAFRPPLVTSTDSDKVIARRMMALAKTPNKLKDKVLKNGWDKKRVIWEKIDDTELESFPELTEDELRDLTMGVYQLKQAKAYTDEHFDENGSYEIMTHKEEDGVLKAQIRSRHTSNKTYNMWIEYTQGLNPIIGWYCGCRSGARTVGCCAHVASVLWYLGYYRTEIENSEAKSSKVHIDFVHDAAVDIWSTSSDSEEDE
ncbi:MAG: transposase family protein, partial [Candidatus Thiodiazotropha endolucinida]|nr:transposase family protein [Candidatus Thiodiazotropha taylori]MCW4264852.1 transposase family protein [Candidatus Thiodiazotropha endolucinida]